MAMAKVYITRLGQMWDEIAREVYGAETYADFLMASNLHLIDTYRFEAGTVIKTPEIPASRDGSLPPWR